jgi:hypothetical protein
VDEWAPYTLAGVFIIGSVLGFIAAVRVFRLVLEYLRDRENSHSD